MESVLENEQLLELPLLKRLSRDMVIAGKTLSMGEVRSLTDEYYAIQDARIAAASQVRSLDKRGEPHEVLTWFAQQQELIESQIKRVLDNWTDSHPVGVWAKSIFGIGPVISAGLLSNIPIERSSTAGHLWSFAGLNPDMQWGKGQKRPFNAHLKTLAVYKLGESFVKVQNNKSDVYGKIYASRKRLEEQRNDELAFKDQAAASIGRFSKSTESYKAYAQGRLPQARIHARARRYAVKLFLAHYHMAAYFHHFQVMPPFPYVFEHHKGHADYVPPPNPHLIPGFAEALATYNKNLRDRISGAPSGEGE